MIFLKWITKRTKHVLFFYAIKYAFHFKFKDNVDIVDIKGSGFEVNLIDHGIINQHLMEVVALKVTLCNFVSSQYCHAVYSVTCAFPLIDTPCVDWILSLYSFLHL